MNAVDVTQFETYRPLMFSIAYRMLGSATDAEDIVQEAYLRYQATAPSQIVSPKAFLSTVVTRLCLNQLRSAKAQRESYLGPWLPEPVLTGADERFAPTQQAELHESLSLAFLVLLEQLTPVDRARRPGRLHRHAPRRPWLAPCAGRDRCIIQRDVDRSAKGEKTTMELQIIDTETKNSSVLTKEKTTELQLVYTDRKYPPVKLIEPTTLSYIHIAAEVQPRALPFSLFMPQGRKKSELLTELKALAHRLEQLDAVEKVTVFHASVLLPIERLPYIKQRKDAIRIPRFDIVVLIETKSILASREVQTTPAYQALVDTLTSKAERMHIITARNAKRIADVDKTVPGLFLFNYFVADDADVMLQLWDYLAGWDAVETGLDNSTLLVPLEGERSDYLAINHARWDVSLLRILWRQFSRATFGIYVQENLEANRVGSLPVWYWLV